MINQLYSQIVRAVTPSFTRKEMSSIDLIEQLAFVHTIVLWSRVVSITAPKRTDFHSSRPLINTIYQTVYGVLGTTIGGLVSFAVFNVPGSLSPPLNNTYQAVYDKLVPTIGGPASSALFRNYSYYSPFN
jgi:hypothetical protein